ncbi:MAG TPA: Fic family protein [Verrucomicrobiae bacterium]|nr:Fic family protein [Verrucomicrobiae bacterium]
MYIHEHNEWPKLHWNGDKLAIRLADVRHRQGRLIGRMEGLGFKLQEEAVLQMLTEDVVKSSDIEGEKLSPEAVRSSIARRMGLDIGGLTPSDRNVDGVVEMMLDATRHYAKPLTENRLFGWHSCLFPSGRNGMTQINVGKWRDDKNGPMQVVSGPIGREKVHYEAPAAEAVPKEMAAFLNWFNKDTETDPVLKAGVAHLWYVTIHPFDDGNGRIARAIADLCLARSEKSSKRFYSMSAQIRVKRKAYYDILEATQKGGTDITPWLAWFLECLGDAINGAENLLAGILAKARFWEKMDYVDLSNRQRQVLNRLLDGFEGKLTTSKWAKLTKSSQDTATRDIQDLIQKNVLERSAEGGRSTSYTLIMK